MNANMTATEARMREIEREREPWTQTFTGRKFLPLTPRIEDIDIVDIAHGLALTVRYNRQAKVPYSVAQHSVLVARSEHIAPQDRLAALLHDAHEAYSPFGDVPRPMKLGMPASMARYVDFIEEQIDRAVARRFGLPFPFTNPAIKELDYRILFDERPAVMSHTEHDWGITGEPLGIEIEAWPWQVARERFLNAFEAYSESYARAQRIKQTREAA